ncbi:molybdopterin molybdotransferase MoeA [Brevibacterium sp. BRM-1]|uniref:molybdopterin molybdotransferase MoeA n=1 Tax=Brevibacterium sp. BRM-1 TaxID=2999062 RepID=UPI00227F75D7|nr:molybdopterin molybdotransferase MoeA [Brevibacterium sp. BRM-1]WAL39803.1 molybdopterin molybdotransferase MoeA [Brevibacterium sp. BRM-1]
MTPRPDRAQPRSAVVLAGGRGSRLGGRTKALFADAAGTTLLASALSAVRAAGVSASRIAVVGGPELAAHLPAGVLLTREEPPFAGPAAAAAAGLEALFPSVDPAGAGAPIGATGTGEPTTGDRAGLVFVVAADMPALAEALAPLARALEEAEGPDAVLARTPRTPDPGEGSAPAWRVQQLLACARVGPLVSAVRGRPLADAPARALWADLRSAAVDLPEQYAADVDTVEDAELLGVRAPSAHPAWREAGRIAHAAAAAGRLGGEEVGLAAAIGRVSAADVRAPADVPHYASSAMDGYAVAGSGPWNLLRATADRDTAPEALAAGQALPVVTGAPVPAGAESILRFEYAEVTGVGTAAGLLSLAPGAPPSDLVPGRHIRPMGREARAGETVVPAGVALSPAHAAYAAVCGIDALPVRRRPRVGLLLTGDEVIEAGMPAPGRVRDAFGPQLPAVFAALGCEIAGVERRGDARAGIDAALDALCLDCDLIVSTGGTGHADVDAVRAAAQDRVAAGRARSLFAELAMRPGHPTFALEYPAPTGRRVLHIALPGNPLAAMVALRVVAQPAVRGLLGQRAEETAVGRVAEAIPGGRAERIVPAARDARGNWAETSGTGSNMLRGLAAADGLIVIPAGGAEDGQEVPLLMLPW